MNNSIKIPTLIFLSRFIKNRIFNSNAKKVTFLTALFSLSLFLNAYAATITSATSGNWNSTTTWVGGVVPTSFDDVRIANGHAIEINANFSCSSLVLEIGASGPSPTSGMPSSLKFLGSNTLTVSGSITVYAPKDNPGANTIN